MWAGLWTFPFASAPSLGAAQAEAAGWSVMRKQLSGLWGAPAPSVGVGVALQAGLPHMGQAGSPGNATRLVLTREKRGGREDPPCVRWTSKVTFTAREGGWTAEGGAPAPGRFQGRRRGG